MQSKLKRLHKYGMGLGLVVGIALSADVALAQEAVEGEEGVVYKKKTVVSFGDDTIDGDLNKPDADYLDVRKRLRHSNLIKIRENFREKILNSFTAI